MAINKNLTLNFEAVTDDSPIRDSIRTEISDSQVSSLSATLLCTIIMVHKGMSSSYSGCSTLFHDLLSSPICQHSVWGEITSHNPLSVKRDQG